MVSLRVCLSTLVLAMAACDKPSSSSTGEKLVPYHASSVTPTTAAPPATVESAAPTVTATATAAATASAPRLSDGPIPDTAELSLERTGCLEACPEYTVTLRADGQVTYDGRSFVRVFGRQTKKVNAAKARALFDRLKTNGFFGWDAMYRYAITDRGTNTVSATWSGQTFSVSEYASCDFPDRPSVLPMPPAALCALQKDIDDVAGTAEWATCKGAGGKKVACPKSKAAH